MVLEQSHGIHQLSMKPICNTKVHKDSEEPIYIIYTKTIWTQNYRKISIFKEIISMHYFYSYSMKKIFYIVVAFLIVIAVLYLYFAL